MEVKFQHMHPFQQFLVESDVFHMECTAAYGLHGTFISMATNPQWQLERNDYLHWSQCVTYVRNTIFLQSE